MRHFKADVRSSPSEDIVTRLRLVSKLGHETGGVANETVRGKITLTDMISSITPKSKKARSIEMTYRYRLPDYSPYGAG